MRAILHIIITTPALVNTLAGTTPLGAVVERRIGTVFPMPLSSLPLLLELELDDVATGLTHIVVVVERNHAKSHFRVSRKPCQYSDRKPLDSIVSDKLVLSRPVFEAFWET